MQEYYSKIGVYLKCRILKNSNKKGGRPRTPFSAELDVFDNFFCQVLSVLLCSGIFVDISIC